MNSGELLERPGRSNPRAGIGLASSYLQAGDYYHMKEQAVYVGVDVAKASLDVAWAGQSQRVPNDVLGRNALVKHLGQIAGEVQVICEASGGYERGLVQALQRSGIKISLVQASRVRQYARASGILAKTDSIDAHLLCRFGEALRPEATTPPKPPQDKLRELETQRRHLGRLLVAQQNRSAQLTRERSTQTEQEPEASDSKTDRPD
jgi:transposase